MKKLIKLLSDSFRIRVYISILTIIHVCLFDNFNHAISHFSNQESWKRLLQKIARTLQVMLQTQKLVKPIFQTSRYVSEVPFFFRFTAIINLQTLLFKIKITKEVRVSLTYFPIQYGYIIEATIPYYPIRNSWKLWYGKNGCFYYI